MYIVFTADTVNANLYQVYSLFFECFVDVGFVSPPPFVWMVVIVMFALMLCEILSTHMPV